MQQLLSTKLFVPQTRPNLVTRPALVEQLNAGLHRKLSLISAPAGFGKTTLASAWVSGLCREPAGQVLAGQGPAGGAPCAIAWVSLDDDDNDPVRFLTYFIAALVQGNGVDPDFGSGMLNALQTPQPPSPESVLVSLINELSGTPDRVMCVFDDYHLIDAGTVHEALIFLLEHMPPQLHLVIATRQDPPLPLGRLRVRDEMTELRAADLRFSASEAADFLNQSMGLNLSPEDVRGLETKTEGWIAGLQLAAISMQGHQDPTEFIRSFTGSNRLVLDFLIEEVLSQQPESVQDFLLHTSILDRLTGHLCDALTGQDNSRETLDMLDHANMFLVPLDEDRQWYRYHHLFADLLHQRLHQTNPDLVQTLFDRASRWFEENGFPDDAIEYALRARDFNRAASLIEVTADAVWGWIKHTKLQTWLAVLPVELVLAKPQLCIFHADYLFSSGKQEEAERSLRAAEIALIPDDHGGSNAASEFQNTEKAQLLGRIAATRSFMASFRSDGPGTIRQARLALEYLPEWDVSWRGAAAIALGDAYVYQGHYPEALQTYLEASETLKATGKTYLYLNASMKQALNLKSHGRLGEAIEICQQCYQLAKESGMLQTEMTGWLAAIWGDALAEQNDLDSALDLVKKGVELTERSSHVAMLSWSYQCLARVLFSIGDLTGVQEIILKIQDIAQDANVPRWITNLMAAWQVRVWLLQDRLEEADCWVQTRGFELDARPTYVNALEYIAFARILIAQGRHADTDRLLQDLLEPAVRGSHVSRSIEILILQAISFCARGNPEQAMVPLKKALTLAESGGFIRIFVDEGPPMASLLYQALERGIMPDYVKKLLAAYPISEPEQTVPTKANAFESGLIEPLSEREIEVLQLLAGGLTNQAIADRLYLSLHTVKAHSRNIYGKLGVNNRAKAGVKGRALGLISETELET